MAVGTDRQQLCSHGTFSVSTLTLEDGSPADKSHQRHVPFIIHDHDPVAVAGKLELPDGGDAQLQRSFEMPWGLLT